MLIFDKKIPSVILQSLQLCQILQVLTTHLSDHDINSAVESLQDEVDRLKKCKHLPESHQASVIGIGDLVNPEVEAKTPKGEVPMPTVIEILQTTSAGLVEHPIQEIGDPDPADSLRIP